MYVLEYFLGYTGTGAWRVSQNIKKKIPNSLSQTDTHTTLIWNVII